MTNDRLNKLTAECESAIEGIRWPKIDPRDVLDLINEIEQLRKVVGCMGRGWDYWFISDSDAKANNLDIAASIFLGIVSGVISNSWGDIAVKTMCAFFFQLALIGCILLFLVIREGMKGMGK